MMDKKNNLLELPRGWVWTRLGEIAEINPKFLENNLNDNIEVSFLPMKAVEERTGKVDLSHVKKVSEVKKGYTSFRDGDILFAKITPCMENGKIAVVNNLKNGIGFGSTEFHVIRLSNLIDEKLLFFLLLQDDYRKTAQRSMTGSAGQLRVPVYFIENTVFPLPPLAEQHRLVAKIEELFTRLDAGVEALKKTKAQLKRYRQAVLKHAFEGRLTEEWRKIHKGEIEPASILLERIKEERKRNAKDKGGRRVIARSESNEAISEDGIASPSARNDSLPKLPVGWAWVRLGEIETFVGSGITPKGGKSVYVSSGISFIRSQNVHPDGLRLDDIAYITPTIHTKMKRTHVYPRDVLLNITGASIGRSTFVPENFASANVNQHVCIIRTGWWILPAFLSGFLNSVFGQKQIFGTQSGATREGLNYEQIKSFLTPLPPLSEQQKMVEEIERRMSVAEEVEKTVEQGLKQAERLRQSILKKAFEGKLVSQDPSDEPASVLLEKIRLQRQQTEKDIKPRRRKARG